MKDTMQEISHLAHESDQCYFRAQPFYQVVSPWHMAQKGLKFKMDLSTGVSIARIPSKIDMLSPDNVDIREIAIQKATVVVPDENGKGDGAALRKRLNSAIPWGNVEELEYILRSCYVTISDAIPALVEAASRGYEKCVEVLLRAGVPGSAPLPHCSSGRNALHMACDNGQESCVKLIMKYSQNIEDIYTTCRSPNEMTCFDLLRRNDLGGMARRLEAYANTLFSKTYETLILFRFKSLILVLCILF